MKLGDDKVPQPGELFQMAPMVDIVFTLLSFFVMATQIRTLEQDFSTGYQQSQLAAGAKQEDFPETVPIRLRALPGGLAAITVGQTHLRDNDFNGLKTTLTEINMPTMGVVIMADPELTVDKVAQAVDAVMASPMKNVSLSRLGGSGNKGSAAAGATPTPSATAPSVP